MNNLMQLTAKTFAEIEALEARLRILTTEPEKYLAIAKKRCETSQVMTCKESLESVIDNLMAGTI
jgi:hypothetical protein